jgi:hypothetical protein
VGYAAGTAMLHVQQAGSRRPIARSPFAMEIVPAATHIPACSLSASDTGETMVAGGERASDYAKGFGNRDEGLGAC